MTPERLEEIRYMMEESSCYERGDWLDAAGELLAEVDRLRAAVERVGALGRFDFDDDMRSHCEDGMYLDADDVLAALEGECTS